MRDPVLATGDGFTYERQAIQTWFEHNDTSPSTGITVESKLLVPNHGLAAQIVEWRSGAGWLGHQ